jgi:nicotinate-nucleotide adenylyltransferase
MRIGLFGGSFDPPHVGHLLIVQDAIEALGLDRLLVIPAATQPLKRDGRTAARHRLAMAERCYAGVAGVTVDPVEVERGGISFMVDTVESMRGRWPGAALHLLVGEDVVATLPQWREPERLLTLVHLVVLRRETTAPDEVLAALADWEGRPGVRPTIQLATRRVDVSSTEIRARVRAGQSIRGFVPDAVASYIESTGLYSAQPAAADDPKRA